GTRAGTRAGQDTRATPVVPVARVAPLAQVVPVPVPAPMPLRLAIRPPALIHQLQTSSGPRRSPDTLPEDRSIHRPRERRTSRVLPRRQDRAKDR
ncbi:hypothetical protein, partial [Arthrobacter sp.]|uniref:hypothetical protein n=1 Tax=Arthrobacter sp. TaxID=1667 RepID=UPI00289E8EAB